MRRGKETGHLFFLRLRRAAQTPEVYQGGVCLGIFIDVLLHYPQGQFSRELFDLAAYTMATLANNEIRGGIRKELSYLKEDVCTLINRRVIK